MEQYLIDSERTVAGNFFEELVPAPLLANFLLARQRAATGIDAAKKGLYYGKDKGGLLAAHTECLTSLDGIPSASYASADADILHAILGVDSEAAELSDLMLGALNGEFIDRDTLIDEAGDVLWYLALLFRSLGTTFEEVARKNIAKLRERFPNKFDADLAINKNEGAERIAQVLTFVG